MSSVTIFGDSITRGAFDLEKGGWPCRLKTYFWNKNYDETGGYYQGVNAHYFGISGDFAEGVLNRFEYEIGIVEKKVKYIVFAVGTNDVSFDDNGQEMVSVDDFEKNITLLVKKASDKVGIENVCFVGITDMRFEFVEQWFDIKRIQVFNKVMHDIAFQKGCHFISMEGIIRSDDLCDDGFHPNSQGHRRMFEHIKDFLEKKVINNNDE